MNDLPTLDALDPRINAFNERIADQRLRDSVVADHYANGTSAQICVPVANLAKKPLHKTAAEAQLLLGHVVRKFDSNAGFAFVQAEHNRYVGWVEEDSLVPKVLNSSHRVCVPRTFVYAEPDLKSQMIETLSLGSMVAVSSQVETRATQYALLETGGAVIARHLCPHDEFEEDYVAVAERLIHTPYLWGGDSAFGLDCSGLVHLSMAMAGMESLRDSDMQAATLGTPLDLDSGDVLKRGDLVFWKGHVAIMRDHATVIHANGNTMDVAIEPLDEAIERIAYLYDVPIGYRRP